MGSSKKSIIWTRPAEDWEHDSKLLRLDQQTHLLRLPLTRQVEVKASLPSKTAEVVILTSRKAADAFLHRLGIAKEQMLRFEFLTFGMETYKYLLSENLRVRLIPAQSGKDFAAALVAELKRETVIWFPRPMETAFPLGEHLRTHQFEAFDIELYRTEPIKQFEAQTIHVLLAAGGVVCFASPMAIKSFVELICHYDEGRFYKYIPVAIGATTRAAGHTYFNEVHLAPHATLQSLWEKALDLQRNQSETE